jgi:Uma2 family endonuclease
MTTASPPPALDGTPLLLHPELRLSPAQFALLCEANPEAVLELSASGQLIQMTPTGGDTSARNTLLLYALQHYARTHGGWKVFDSSGGFLLPDRSVLSPDASLVRLERWQSLAPEQRRAFPPLCPDVVIELTSPSDAAPRGLEALRRKMEVYRANGAQLGWLLIPEQQAVEIWRASNDPGAAPERLEPSTARLEDPLLPGLQLDLAELWAA